jgi:hypothetical protein
MEILKNITIVVGMNVPFKYATIIRKGDAQRESRITN